MLLRAQAFDGSDLRGATFTNSILSSATFGKDSNGVWANLEGKTSPLRSQCLRLPDFGDRPEAVRCALAPWSYARCVIRDCPTGVEFEGALLSSSDARQVCNNPTLDDYGKAIIGCR